MEAPKRDPAESEFDGLVQRNVETITRIEQAAQAGRTKSDVVSDAIAGFCGSPLFVYVHVILFGTWLVWNAGSFVPKGVRFDLPPFTLLTLVVSLEAIFLSTFILISQNRQQRLAEQRNHLDLQINMLAEQESSQMLTMMKQVMDHLGIEVHEGNTYALQQETDAERVSEQIQQSLDASDVRPGPDTTQGL